mmetsp:Transcript_82380/g.266799  ORF Transcript_82380/g.266799 Transcript_82380/m.266799 type:complete len:284 (-) Transcript_82380:228-1079(-)
MMWPSTLKTYQSPSSEDHVHVVSHVGTSNRWARWRPCTGQTGAHRPGSTQYSAADQWCRKRSDREALARSVRDQCSGSLRPREPKLCGPPVCSCPKRSTWSPVSSAKVTPENHVISSSPNSLMVYCHCLGSSTLSTLWMTMAVLPRTVKGRWTRCANSNTEEPSREAMPATTHNNSPLSRCASGSSKNGAGSPLASSRQKKVGLPLHLSAPHAARATVLPGMCMPSQRRAHVFASCLARKVSAKSQSTRRGPPPGPPPMTTETSESAPSQPVWLSPGSTSKAS